MNDYCVVMTTFENDEQANKVIEAVLADKLAACIQTTNISSHQSWKGEICHDKEILAMFKTPSRLFGELKDKIKSIHSYETPEIIKLPIEDGFVGYLKWMDDVTE